jgi:glycosyltransferase involved in cell wall biosynthesis
LEFKVSVVIPVYNAAAFVSKAVESAVSLPEVGEIILIEDGSPDDALAVCMYLEMSHEKVRLFRHPNGENRGAGESRNLGIKMASYEFISFLDADDWYLPHRFVKDKVNFLSNPNADACYSCTILETDQHDPVNLRYGVRSDLRLAYGPDISPVQFYKLYIEKKWLLFNTNSITLRRAFLMEEKCFDPRLLLHQDTELWMRLLRRGNFYVSEWETPVAVVRRHEGNRIVYRSNLSRLKMFAVYLDNVGIDNLFDFEVDIFFNRILRIRSSGWKSTTFRRMNLLLNHMLFYFFKKVLLRSTVKSYA